jgi:hypothetical protein
MVAWAYALVLPDVEGAWGREAESGERGSYRIHDCSEIRLPRNTKPRSKDEKGKN